MMQFRGADPSLFERRDCKRRSQDGEGATHSWLSEKIPKCVKCSQAEQAARNESDRCMLMDVLDACLMDRGNINVAYAAVKQRLQSRCNAGRSFDESAKFDKVTQIDRLDAGWVREVILNHSELTVDDIVPVERNTSKGLHEILMFLFGFPAAMRVPPKCIVKAVAYQTCSERIKEVGARGRLLKSSGIVSCTGKLE